MKSYFVYCVLFWCSLSIGYAQGTFQTANGGNWNSASSWTLLSGTDADGIPDANDHVTIRSSHTINISTASACSNLTFNGGTISFTSNNTLAVGGNVSVTSNSNINGYSNNHIFQVAGNLSVNTSTTLSVGAVRFTVSGTSTLNGGLAVSGYGQTRTFGNITINASGSLTFSGGDTYNMNGSITNNGTFTASDFNQVFNFNSSSGTFGGANQMSFFRAVFNSPANYTNNGNIQIRNQMSGTGAFTNGTGGNLELINGGPFTVTTFNASATGNTITYTGSANPTGFPGSYYNLVINKSSGALGFSGSPSILNDLTIQSGIFQVAAVTVGIGNDLNLQGGEFTPDNASAVVNIGGDFNISGGEYDHNNGDVNVTGDISVTGGTFNFSGASSTLDGASLSLQGVTLNLGQGTITTTGNLNVETGTDLNGTGATLNIGGNLAFNDGAVDFTAGNLSANNVTIATGETMVFTNVAFTSTGTTTINGTLSITGSSGTKSFGNIVVGATGVYNVTQPNPFIVSGNITNNGSFTGCPGYGTCTYTLTSTTGSLSGSGALSMRDLIINSPASYTNQTNLTITQSITGTGTFINANGASLELQGTGPFSVSTFNASAATNTVTYSGAGSPSLNSGSYYNLVVNKSSGTISIGSATSVGNNLTVSSGILAVGAATLNVTNNLLLQGGEFTPDNASGVTNIGGDFVISGGGFDHNSGQVNVTGSLEQTAGAILFSGASSTLDVSDTFSFEGGTADFQQGSFLPDNLYVATSNILTINSAILNVSGQVELDGTLTFNNGTGSKTLNNILVNASGNWNVTQDVSFTVSGNITNNGTFTGSPSFGTSTYTLTSTSGTLSGSGTINMRGVAINSPANITNQGLLNVANTLTGTGTFTNGASGTFTYTGNNSAGTNFTITNFNASATGNTVVFAGTTNQGWRATTTANNDYFNVIVNMGTGGSTRLNLLNHVRVNGTLTITEGDPVLGAFNLELGASASVSGGDFDDWIRINSTGVVRKFYSGFGNDLVLPIGDADDYSPITSFVVHSATLGANPYVNFSITDDAHPNRSTNNIALGGNDDGVTAVDYITRYWTLSANDMSNPDYTASYQYTNADIVGNEANMIAALYGQPPGETFFDWKETGTVNATNNTATISNGDYWGALYAMDNDMDRLPVELLSFTGQATDNSVFLKWSTASEVNNSYFSIERSTDGLSFKEISIVQGNGTTNNKRVYGFEDRFPPFGRSYYRLKQVDFNGQFEYSGLVSVLWSGKPFQGDLHLYPNPIQRGEILNLELKEAFSEESIQAIIVDPNGGSHRIDFHKEFSSRFTTRLPQNLNSGVHVITINLKGQSVKKKILIN